MAVTFTHKPKAAALTPLDALVAAMEEKPYTILDALKELASGKKGTLMFINKASGMGYVVIGHSQGFPTTLRGPDKHVIHAMITEREANLYQPLWRV